MPSPRKYRSLSPAGGVRIYRSPVGGWRWFAGVAVGAAALFGVAWRANAEIGYFQSFRGASTASGSVSVTTTAATSRGNLLVAVVSITASSNITVSTVPTATAETGYNNSWTLITSSVQNSGTRSSIRLYYIENAASQPSGTVQTWTLSGTATAATVTISEYRGAKTSGALGDFAALSSGASSSQGTGVATSVTADIDGMLIAAVNKASNVTFSSVNNSFTLRADSQTTAGTSLSHIMLDRQVTAATTLPNTVVTLASGSYIGSGAIAIFKPAPVTTKYWIGNGSSTDCLAASNWSTFSGGASFNVAPTSSTDVVFDDNGLGSCTVGTATTWNSLTVGAGYSGTITVSADLVLGDGTKVATVGGGTVAAGGATLTFSGGLTVSGSGTLDLTSTGTIAIGDGKTLTIDGTLKATDSSTIPTIRAATTGSYSFKVGSSGTATPTLNIDGLNVMNTAANGMYVNTVSGSSTTFTRFDKIAFSNGTGTQLLKISAATLYLSSSGCTFDAGAATGSTTYAVTLTGNGSSGTPDSTETRALFGSTTCAANWTVGASDRSCLNVAAGTGTTAKLDDDAEGDGAGNNPASDGAVLTFVRATGTDTAGTIVGLPTAAFDWNTFTYYSTYVAYNAASGTSAIVYVRNGAGVARYSWTAPAGETIVGTPRWNTDGSTHYLYVALASGKVYRLIDDTVAGTLTPDNSGNWAGANNPFDCGCTIVTPLALDANSLYWGGTASSTQRIWTLSQSSRTQPFGSPITITPVITSAAPALWLNGSTSHLFIGLTGHIVQLDVTNQVLSATNDSPDTASVWGRIGTNGSNRIFAGDDGGNMWAIDPANFAGTNKVWSYLVSGDAIKSSSFYDFRTGILHFGTEGGKVVALDSTGAPLTGYPYTPGTAGDAIRSALLFSAGILAAGTTTGKLFFIDRQTGSGPALIRQYSFGSTESVSGIGYDPVTRRYMVSTSDPTTKNGRLYYIDLIVDPTPGSS